MTREEIKNKLYYVAYTIRMDTDKFDRGEAFEKYDWIKAVYLLYELPCSVPQGF